MFKNVARSTLFSLIIAAASALATLWVGFLVIALAWCISWMGHNWPGHSKPKPVVNLNVTIAPSAGHPER